MTIPLFFFGPTVPAFSHIISKRYQAKNVSRLLIASAQTDLNNCENFCSADNLLVWVNWSWLLSVSVLLWEQRLLLCTDGRCWEHRGVWLRHSQAAGDEGHTGSHPFMAIMFSPSPNCWELPGVRRGQAGGPNWGFYWTAETGSWRWLLIRDWTAANLPAASAQCRDYWTMLWFDFHSGFTFLSFPCPW